MTSPTKFAQGPRLWQPGDYQIAGRPGRVGPTWSRLAHRRLAHRRQAASRRSWRRRRASGPGRSQVGPGGRRASHMRMRGKVGLASVGCQQPGGSACPCLRTSAGPARPMLTGTASVLRLSTGFARCASSSKATSHPRVVALWPKGHDKGVGCCFAVPVVSSGRPEHWRANSPHGPWPKGP